MYFIHHPNVPQNLFCFIDVYYSGYLILDKSGIWMVKGHLSDHWMFGLEGSETKGLKVSGIQAMIWILDWNSDTFYHVSVPIGDNSVPCLNGSTINQSQTKCPKHLVFGYFQLVVVRYSDLHCIVLIRLHKWQQS